MKLPKMKMGGVLNNKPVLYLTLLVSLVYIIKDLYDKNNFNVALFLLIGYIMIPYYLFLKMGSYSVMVVGETMFPEKYYSFRIHP